MISERTMNILKDLMRHETCVFSKNEAKAMFEVEKNPKTGLPRTMSQTLTIEDNKTFSYVVHIHRDGKVVDSKSYTLYPTKEQLVEIRGLVRSVRRRKREL